MELILRWDVRDQVLEEMKDILYKCYRFRAELDMFRFPASWQRHLGESLDTKSAQNKFIGIIRSQGIK